MKANNTINTDRKKRRSFVALLFAAGYGERSAAERPECEGRRPLWMGNIERGKK